jgi:hypothetical protein
MDDHDELSAASAGANRTDDAVAAPNKPKAADRRIQRLDEVRAEAEEETDPLRGNLRAATADLLEICYRFSTEIKAGMSSELSGSKTCDEKTMLAIRNMVLMYRQATRYVQLDRDWSRDN